VVKINETQAAFIGISTLLLLFFGFLGYVAYIGHTPVVILSQDKKSVILTNHFDKTRKEILNITKLPKKSTVDPDFGFSNHTFNDASLSPQHDFVAFSVHGVHDWIGLYNIKNEDITDIDSFSVAIPGNILWSPNNRFFAIEILPASGYKTIGIYDIKLKKALETPYEQRVAQEQLDVTKPQWSRDGSTLSVILSDPSTFFNRGKHYTIIPIEK